MDEIKTLKESQAITLSKENSDEKLLSIILFK